MTNEFRKVGWTPVTPDAFGVAVASGLSLIPDEAIVSLTGGVVQPPAAVFVADTVSVSGKQTTQTLLTVDSLASLHGSLVAWAERLPVGARDQFYALSAEARAKFEAGVAEHWDGRS